MRLCAIKRPSTGLIVSLSMFSWLPYANAEGFVEDAKVGVNFRNFFLSRDFIDNGPSKALPGPTKHGKAQEWTQSVIIDARSGFTTGAVGFGVDTLGMYSIKLDGGPSPYS